MYTFPKIPTNETEKRQAAALSADQKCTTDYLKGLGWTFKASDASSIEVREGLPYKLVRTLLKCTPETPTQKETTTLKWENKPWWESTRLHWKYSRRILLR